MTAPQIDRDDDNGGGSPWRWLGLLGAGFASVTMLGAVAGFLSEALKDGWSAFTVRDGVVLGVLVAVAAGCAYAAVRLSRRLFGPEARIPTRERRSRNYLLASFGIGVVTAIVLLSADVMSVSDDPLSILSDSPISPVAAVALSLLLLTVLPVLGWRWQKTVDEHEREAYQSGALAAAYMFQIVAPVWWLLWRGGLVPEVNGIILYLAFDFTFLTVWFWKKYR